VKLKIQSAREINKYILFIFNKNKRTISADVDSCIDTTTSKPRKEKFYLRDSSGYVTKRNNRKIIRFRHYGKLDVINYNREQLMLFVPWRDETTELLHEPVKKATRLKDMILENSKPFYKYREVDDEMLSNLVNDLEENLEHENPDILQNEYELLQQDNYFEQDSTEKTKESSRVEQFLPPRRIDEECYKYEYAVFIKNN